MIARGPHVAGCSVLIKSRTLTTTSSWQDFHHSAVSRPLLTTVGHSDLDLPDAVAFAGEGKLVERQLATNGKKLKPRFRASAFPAHQICRAESR
jgi:hypothetical protein